MPSCALRSLLAAVGVFTGLAAASAQEKIQNPTAVFSGLDKITGRIVQFDVAVDETVQFGALQVTPKTCQTNPSTEQPETVAFVEVDEITLQKETKRIFSGWMFAASPGLNAVEHSIYDVWLVDCKGGKGPAAPVIPDVGQQQPDTEPEPESPPSAPAD